MDFVRQFHWARPPVEFVLRRRCKLAAEQTNIAEQTAWRHVSPTAGCLPGSGESYKQINVVVFYGTDVNR